MGVFRSSDWLMSPAFRLEILGISTRLPTSARFQLVAQNPPTWEHVLCCVRGSVKHGLTSHAGPRVFTTDDVLS